MHIILTHEQADFDALASLLGASLLIESAIPVLPRRMNRNGRAFLALYGAELPFVDPRELPADQIDKVTLVDTQAMVSVKGMVSDLKVDVIDHHPRRDGIPPDWKLSVQDVGATTTLLVEALQDHDGPLNPVHATLLLLGIYEDTGSLTYTRTTARDLRAAAALIEMGASLSIAGEYLHHPLSPAQLALYDRLRASARHLTIQGHSVVVTSGHALEMEEELSSITHQLRDLMDPDALFVLVTTRSGVQIIARSTSDDINVADILARFNGGGHERAAAGLVRGRTIDEIESDLIAAMPQFVRPAITVTQLMSGRPQLLSPETTVEEASRRMRLYGHEGYPVVQDGHVVGLLTRRMVDKATSQHLNVSITRLMDKGSYSVAPGDSIEHVQRLVVETGWGQIPVVDPQDGEIIGIVTRTDLLKNLSPDLPRPQSMNLATRLEAALPADRLGLLQAIALAAHEHRCALYIVGGYVRDLILDRPSLDFDLVVEGDAIALARALARRHGGRVTSHARFGTAKWHLETARGDLGRLAAAGLPSVDLVSARTEFYTHPTALPTVERGSIKLDLHRRDFTINTLALRLDGRHYGELHDYWGGLSDLRAGVVRVLHSLSFVDDPTRILRAVRFEQRFAFRIEENTLGLLTEARSMIERLTGERIRHELNHILASRFAPQIFRRLHELDLLHAIHSNLFWDDWLYQRIETLTTVEPGDEWGLEYASLQELRQELGYILLLINLPPEHADGVIHRLRLTAQLADTILSACSLWSSRRELVQARPSQATAKLEDIPPLARYAVFIASSDAALRGLLREYVTNWQHIHPYTDGNSLKMMGLTPGPLYRKTLGELRRAWLDGDIHSEVEEKQLLAAILATGKVEVE